MAIAKVQSVAREGFQGANAATTGTLGSTPTIGNVLILHIGCHDAASGRVFTEPTGWTKIKEANQTSENFSAAWFYRVVQSGDGTSYTVTWTNDSFHQDLNLIEYSGVDTSTPIDVSAAAMEDAGFTSAWSASAITIATANALDIVSVYCPAQTMTIDQAGYTNESGTARAAIFTKTLSVGSTGARTGTNSNWSKLAYSFALRPFAAVTREQEGYRWRADDGSETTGTWLASQDTDISRTKDTVTRLRTLVDTVGDAPSEAFILQYRKNGVGSFRDVPTGI